MAKATLRRTYLNSQGYDSAGSYWGLGQPLYWLAFEGPDGQEISEFLRAPGREHAKRKAREMFPHVDLRFH
jgi:hypothetical protein